MSANRRLRADLSERACLQCQKRKTRCVSDGDGGPCAYCTKMGKSCVFEGPPTRTPLTRKNLDAAEARCKELERRMRKLQADLKLNSSHDNSTGSNEYQGPGQPTHSAASADREPVEAPVELGFEWQETFSLGDNQGYLEGKKIQDGMVSLAASGYLGNSSGSSLLESLLPPAERRSADDDTERQRPVSNLPSPLLNLPFGNRLATTLIQSHLIDAYFVAYNSSYPIVHERTFRNQCGRRLLIPAQSPWHIVYYMVLAIGEWVSGYGTDDHSLYYEAAHTRIRTEILESGNMVIVQALLLLGNYLQKRDRPNTGYNFLGIAYRVALGLGLHREISSAKDKFSFLLQRRRLLFWALYCFDSGFSITTGRPIMVADSFIDVRKPKNVDDSLCEWSSPLPSEVDYPTSCSAIIAQARLAVIANKVYSTFLATQPCPDVNHSLAVMEQNLQNWRSALPVFFFNPEVPNWFIGPRQVVLWKETNLRILLLLASQRQQNDEHDKAAIGAKYEIAAVQTISDITDFCQVHADVVHVGLSWYAVYFLLQAILALGVNQLRANFKRDSQPPSDESDVPSWETAFARARQCLENLGRFFNPSTRTLRILDRLRSKIRKAATHSRPTENQSRPPIITTTDVRAIVNEEHDSITLDGHSTTPGVLGPSPDAANVIDFIEGEWISTVDPSLHMFLDDVDNIGNLFQGIQGFPNIMELDDFSYTTSGINTMRMAYPSQSPWQNAEKRYQEFR
ncbi:fungal-specific transcription factor domain-containing protein [Lipomyces doorenjongii]